MILLLYRLDGNEAHFASFFDQVVQRATLAPSGDRLLITLRVKAKEAKSWLGLRDEADIYVWGRPVIDPDQQIVHLGDMEVDVSSQAAFGLLGKAADVVFPFRAEEFGREGSHRPQAVCC